MRGKILREAPSLEDTFTEEDWRWKLMVTWQRGRCAICGQRGYPLVRDHDHQTWLIRGLLCQTCNMAEGRGHFPKYRAIHPALICGVRQEYYSSWAGAMLRPAPPEPRPPVCRPPSYTDSEVIRDLAAAAICNAETVTVADLRALAEDNTDLLAQAAACVISTWVRWRLAERIAAVRLLVEAGADESLIDGWDELKAEADLG